MNATRDIERPSVRPSVCLSATLRYCVKTNERIVEILLPPQSAIASQQQSLLRH